MRVNGWKVKVSLAFFSAVVVYVYMINHGNYHRGRLGVFTTISKRVVIVSRRGRKTVSTLNPLAMAPSFRGQYTWNQSQICVSIICIQRSTKRVKRRCVSLESGAGGRLAFGGSLTAPGSNDAACRSSWGRVDASRSVAVSLQAPALLLLLRGITAINTA